MYVKMIDGMPEKYALRTLRKANPNTSFPEDPTADLLAEWGLYPYVATDKPAHDAATQVVEHQGYAATGGTYTDVYSVRDKTTDELAADLDKARALAWLEKGEFCIGLIALGVLEADEAVLASRGDWPSSMDAFLSYLPPDEARVVQIEWATSTTIRRMNVFVLTLASWADIDDPVIDTLFGIGEAGR
jgi:hypothetical protein